MDGGLHIRAATVDDAEAIARLHIRVWQVAYRGHIPDDYLDGLDRDLPRRVGWRRELLADTSGAGRTWLAELDGRLVAFLDTGPSRDADANEWTGEVFALYVDQALAGRGIGRALMAHGVEDMRARGFVEATLWVLSSNEQARRFYEAMGWRPDGTEKIESRPGLELRELRYRIGLRP
jgi:ribosomal protein S18 acetylase RimI-like enzyme